MSTVLVLAELTPSGVRPATFELLTAARALGDPAAVVVGEAGDDVVAQLGNYGATTVYAVGGAAAEDYLSVPKAEALVQVAQQANPSAILITSGSEGKDIAARVAVRLDSGIVTDAVSVADEGGTIVAAQAIVAGTYHATSEVTRGPAVITMRPNATNAEQAAATPSVENVDVAISDAAKGASITARNPKVSTGRPELTDAAVVVAGGRGVGSPEGMGVIEQLADTLGGAVGATRAVTDLGWAAHDIQVGQTGKTVAPSLYVAAGVSGAIQHRAGMQSSKTIVAVNKDANAPIFAISDFGVVGDLHQVLPALVDAIAAKRG
ncbi:MAG: electron transfer flavoprotein subunit alpha/FixB family protein [Tetrasphaera sp.]